MCTPISVLLNRASQSKLQALKSTLGGLEVRIYCDGERWTKLQTNLELAAECKNIEGTVMAKLSKIKDGDSSIVAEVLAIEVAVDMALRQGRRYVHFDSKVAIEST